MSILRIILCTAGGGAIGYLGGRSLGKNEEEKRKFGNIGLALGSIGGLGIGIATLSTKNKVNYIQYHKGNRAYDGITTIGRQRIREYEHRHNGKKFDKVVYGPPKTLEEAIKLEQKRIKRFKCKGNIHHNPVN